MSMLQWTSDYVASDDKIYFKILFRVGSKILKF